MNDELPTKLKPHRGVFVITFGVLSFIGGCFGIVFGPIAWICGRRDLKEMDAGVMDSHGRALTQTGQVLGMIMTFFWFLVPILAIIVMGVVGLLIPRMGGSDWETSGATDSGYEYYDESDYKDGSYDEDYEMDASKGGYDFSDGDAAGSDF